MPFKKNKFFVPKRNFVFKPIDSIHFDNVLRAFRTAIAENDDVPQQHVRPLVDHIRLSRKQTRVRT